ncbi:MAG: hypothetical protein GY772_15805 [bacterium]|nr:hypothetical protein [bacterium]
MRGDDTHNVCDAACTKTLYEFRCYPRTQRNMGGMQGIRENMNGRLRVHTTKECGRHLFGVQFETSKLLEEKAANVQSCVECGGRDAAYRTLPVAFNTTPHNRRHFL